jgi:Domain of unknown function (DUF1127)
MLLIHWHETRSRPRQRNALFALNDAASHVLALLREWRRRSKERTQFAKLDDRMLKDIGLLGPMANSCSAMHCRVGSLGVNAPMGRSRSNTTAASRSSEPRAVRYAPTAATISPRSKWR